VWRGKDVGYRYTSIYKDMCKCMYIYFFLYIGCICMLTRLQEISFIMCRYVCIHIFLCIFYKKSKVYILCCSLGGILWRHQRYGLFVYACLFIYACTYSCICMYAYICPSLSLYIYLSLCRVVEHGGGVSIDR
jgi:hypothetical protein